MKTILSVICLMISAHLMGQSEPLILNKVIARVGGEHILYTELQELHSYARQQSADDSDIQCEIMDQLIAKSLLLDQARIDSIVISDVEIEAQLAQRIDYILAQMGGSEERFVQYYGVTPQQQRDAMREPMREEMIQQRIQNSLIQAVVITPKEVVDYYGKIPQDSLPYLNAEVEVGEIVMKTQLSNAVKEAAREKIEKVHKRIVEEGEDFAELASLFSDDPGSARTGGDLGWAKRGSYVPEFEATAFNLDVGEVSEIIETKYGYHFMELIARRGNNINVRHILIKPEVTQEDIDKTKSILDSVAHLITVDSLPFDYAVRLYSDDEQRSYNNAGRLINDQTGDTFWETNQLPYQIYFAIESLDIGAMSEVLEFEERGEKVFKIIQLQSRSRPHQASLETDFARLEQMAKESKKNEYFNNWMDQKVKDTRIMVVDEFRSCPNLVQYNPKAK